MSEDDNGGINAYNFVRPLFGDEGRPDSGFLAKKAPESHADYKRGRRTGAITCSLRLLAPFFIPDPRKKRYLDNGHRLSGYFTLDPVPLVTPSSDENGSGAGYEWKWDPKDPSQDATRPAIPGTSLRGMVRSIYETLTDSCFAVFDPKAGRGARLWPYLHPCSRQDARLEGLCPACRIFGAVAQRDDDNNDGSTYERDEQRWAWASHVQFGHGTLKGSGDGFEVDRVHLPALSIPEPEGKRSWQHYVCVYPNRADHNAGTNRQLLRYDVKAAPRWARLRGRKFYRHRPEVWDAEGVDKVPRASAGPENYNQTIHLVYGEPTFEFKVYFDSLTDVELGGLLTALELSFPTKHPVPLAHQLGMGKPLGLGSCKVVETQLTLSPMPDRYGVTEQSSLSSRSRRNAEDFIEHFWWSWRSVSEHAPTGMEELVEMLRLNPPVENGNIEYKTKGVLPTPIKEQKGVRYGER